MGLKLFAELLAFPRHLLCSCLYLIDREKRVEQEMRGRKDLNFLLAAVPCPCCTRAQHAMAVWEHHLWPLLHTGKAFQLLTPPHLRFLNLPAFKMHLSHSSCS